MPGAVIASAVIGSATAVYSGNQQAKAIKNAGNIQQQSSNQALQFQQQARDQAKAVLSKYSVEGDASRGRQNAFLGLNKPGAPYSGGMGSASSTPDYAAYVNSNPDLAAEFAKPGVSRQFGGDPAAYGQWHAQNYAHEGRAVPTSGMGQPGQADPTKTEAETQEQAWAAYEASPWGKIGTMEADTARDNFLTMAGAQGSALSGRTARGMAEVSEEAKLRNFMGYYGALGEVTDRGYVADTGIASGGQAFADRASNITQQAGANAGQLAIAKGENQANTANDLASWIGWGMGNMGTGSAGAGGRGGSAAPTGSVAPSSRANMANGSFRARIT